MIGVKTTRRPGFTLIEMLLVVLIFSLASAALAQIFVNITRLQRKVANQAALSQDMRFATEMIVRAARNNFIDYTGQPLANVSSVLSLTRPGGGGSILITTQDAQAVCLDLTAPAGSKCLALSTDDGATWNQVTSHRVNVTRFDVYVHPSSDPFQDVSINVQPLVTVNLELQFLAVNAAENMKLQTQSTVSSRLYSR